MSSVAIASALADPLRLRRASTSILVERPLPSAAIYLLIGARPHPGAAASIYSRHILTKSEARCKMGGVGSGPGGEGFLIEEASAAIEQLGERDRRAREFKYARRNRMRYIDKLLNELEMLNLADRSATPAPLKLAVDQLIEESDLEDSDPPRSTANVIQAMDILYDIQDSLMFTQIEDE